MLLSNNMEIVAERNAVEVDHAIIALQCLKLIIKVLTSCTKCVIGMISTMLRRYLLIGGPMRVCYLFRWCFILSELRLLSKARNVLGVMSRDLYQTQKLQRARMFGDLRSKYRETKTGIS